MKLSDTSRIGVDVADLDPDFASKAELLLTHTNTSIRNIYDAVSGALSLSDNVQCEVVSPTLSHGVAQTVSLKKLARAHSVLSYSVIGSANGANHALAVPPIIQQTGIPGQVRVTALFLDTTAKGVKVSLSLVPEGQSGGKAPNLVPTWTTPTLAGAWVNFGGSNQVAGYCKDSLGFVHLRGTVASGAGIIFTLPTGFRPSKDIFFPVDAASVYGRIKVQASTGLVAQDVGGNAATALDPITFMAEQ